MLTDIFARRYENVPMWQTFDEPSRRLTVQTFQLLQQIVPYYANDGKELAEGKANWTQLHTRLARELGVQELSPIAWGYWAQNYYCSGQHPIIKVCETWMLQPFDGSIPADRFIKERLSLIELGFRQRGEEVAYHNGKLPEYIAKAQLFEARRSPRVAVPANQVADKVKAANASMNAAFQEAVIELNARFRQAGLDLHYHNGFIQVASDPMVAQEIEVPFWQLVADPKWTNVDHDFKEAVDLRDTNGRDPPSMLRGRWRAPSRSFPLKSNFRPETSAALTTTSIT
jgi:AbiJ-like protein